MKWFRWFVGLVASAIAGAAVYRHATRASAAERRRSEAKAAREVAESVHDAVVAGGEATIAALEAEEARRRTKTALDSLAKRDATLRDMVREWNGDD